MRIGFSAMLLRDNPFGVSISIRALGRALIRTRGENEVVFYARGCPEAEQKYGSLQSTEFRIAPRFTRWRAGRMLWEQTCLRRRCSLDRLDVLHAPGYLMPLNAPVPVVLLVHDILALTRPELCKPLNRLNYRLMLPLSIRRAAKIMVFSRCVRDQLLERFGLPEDRISVVSPGVDRRLGDEPSAATLESVRRRHGLERPFALFIGNPEPKKNLARLLDAFSLAKAHKQIDGDLVLAGGRSTALKASAAYGEPDVRRIGYVPRVELLALLRMARLLAFPSLAEGFGFPVLEAMASGLPVVGSNVPAVRETDPQAVVIVDPLDTSSIAAGLESAWNDEQLRERARAKGLVAASRFSWDRAGRETWKIYAELLGS